MTFEEHCNYIDQFLPTEFHKDLFSAALENLGTANKLRFNNFAYAMRELLREVFYHNAPDDEVLGSQWYKDETDKLNQITRKQRIRYMLYGGVSPKIFSENLVDDINDALKNIVSNIDELSKYTHIGKDTFDIDSKNVEIYSTNVMLATTNVINLIIECRNEIKEYLHDTLNDAVEAVLYENVFDALDDKSSHTTADEANLDAFHVVNIDSKYVYIEGDGTIGCELQYGSSSDVRKGDGWVTSTSFPFNFECRASALDLTQIDISPHDITIDDSGWYDET